MAQLGPEQQFSRLWKRQLIVLGMAAALMACGSNPQKEAVPSGDDGARPLPRETFALDQMKEKVRADLAGRLLLPVDLIEVVDTRAVRWTDDSLGCTEHGHVYQSSGGEGWVITLAHQGRRTVYHADRYQAIPCPAIEAE